MCCAATGKLLGVLCCVATGGLLSVLCCAAAGVFAGACPGLNSAEAEAGRELAGVPAVDPAGTRLAGAEVLRSDMLCVLASGTGLAMC